MARKDRKLRKKKKRQERLRQEKHQQRTLGFPHADRPGWVDQPSDVVDDDLDDFDDEDSGPLTHVDLGPAGARPFSQYAMERTLRKMAHAMKAQSFNSMADMNAFLQSKFVGKVDDDLSKLGDPKEHAQELAFQAMEADNEFDAKRLAQEALKLDPDCVDARVRIAHLNCRGNEEQLLNELQSALEEGKRALGGDEFFRENEGHFWGQVHTRPYMRALSEMAHLLYFTKQYDQACSRFEEMLELNPGDNQGIRYPFLGCVFLASKIDVARKILETFADEDSALMNWARVLERFLSCDESGASKLLKKAIRQNKHVAPMLLGQKEPPPAMGGYSPGHESEAREILLNFGMAWVKHSAALEWLGRQCGVKVIPKPGI